MTQRAPFLILVACLIAGGIATASIRHSAYDIPWLPGEETQLWQIEARIEFTALDGPTQVLLSLPPPQSGFEIVRETGASSGWGWLPPGSDRTGSWTRREASGDQVLFYNIDLIETDGLVAADAPESPAPPIWDEPYRTAVNDGLSFVMPISADEHSLTEQLIRLLGRQPADQNATLLKTSFGLPELIERILATADVAARRVQVLELEDNRRRQSLVEYVQVWDGSVWRLYDPAVGVVEDASRLLLWQVDEPGLLEVQGGRNSRISFSIISQNRSMLSYARERAEETGLSLYSLPVAEQGMFKLIMLLPVGAFVVVVMRILVGMRTSGTFMPVLIALAFLQTDLIPGLISFVIVIAIGLAIRSYLSDLNLLLVARIATLVVIVIGIITLFSVVSYRLGLIQGLTITFFPMIILAWTIERLSIIWEEEGPYEVFVQGGGSLLVAVAAYLLMDLSTVRHLAFNFPELHLALIGAMMLVGRYTGYRLLELKRFSAFDSNG